MVYEPLLPTRLAQLLEERGVDPGFRSPTRSSTRWAPTSSPWLSRVALAVEGNPRTRARMERAGVEVLSYRGEELSKGDGGPTRPTRPLLRV